ncbi:MAG: type IV toxin-antitoxin system AbiEi family antitoxin domain-containing protein [Candidatus Omnitrophica bacterium]|nr:type IV toxin-antitoxin system AbiEi family antitoxin domain-containing protein [Candidatus Omnitrophota bacterium]
MRGFVFTKYQFFDLGNPKTVAKVLERMAESGEIRRIARGLYDYPQKHSTLGDVPPNLDHIADALSEKDNLKIQPSGAYAANLLGLSDQVPARIVF